MRVPSTSRTTSRKRSRRSSARRASTTPRPCTDGGADRRALRRPPATDAAGARARAEDLRPAGAEVLARGAGPRHLRALPRPARVEPRWGPRPGPRTRWRRTSSCPGWPGSRILELKTVQINDRLVLPRPCIDATTVGYNVEWSQELRLADSLREYVAGSMLLDVLKAENLLGLPSDRLKQDTILDMSVGYDLAGIRSPQVRAWIESMKDAARGGRGPAARDPGRPAALARPRLHDPPLRPDHALHLPRLPGGRDRRHRPLPAHGDGRARDGEAQPDAAGPGGRRRPAARRARATTRSDARGGLRQGPAVGAGPRDHRPAVRAWRARCGRTFQVKFSNTLVVRNHRDVLPGGGVGDVPLRRPAARGHA